MLEVGILGPLQVRAGDTPVRVTGARGQLLFATLALARNRPVPADRLVDVLWGDAPPGKPANALQARVAQLRRALAAAGSERSLVTTEGGYRLDLPTGALDAERFAQMLDRGTAELAGGDPDAAAATLRAALAMWRGDPLDGLPAAPVVTAEARRLAELRLVALERRIDADLAAGDAAELVGELRSLVAAHPLRERLRGQLMVALYRAGRQSEALDAYADLRSTLRDELGLEPSAQLRSLHRGILAQDAGLATPSRRRAAPAPPAPLTSFVGRTDEVKQVTELLGDHRLVTLVGPGGTGKTRLAVEIARGLAGRFPDGAVLADLSPVADGTGIEGQIASALGIGARAPGPGEQTRPVGDRLLSALADRTLLLVLDNCEHLLDALAPVTQRLLQAAGGLTVLATSREALRVPGESLWPVPPLRVPRPGEDDPARLLDVDAVRLFVDRATAIQPGFRLDPGNAAAVVEICRRLDGLPLALELAAARTSALPVTTLARRLGDRFRLLIGGSRTAARRQQTLEAVVDWSYGLLDDEQRRVFRQLSVFAGGWTLDAAEAVCRGGDVLRVVPDLVDKSLVTVLPGHAGAEPRYAMLETLREFALGRLLADDDPEAARSRHTAWYAALAVEADARLRGAEQLHALAVVESEHDNLRAALEWSLAVETPAAIGTARDLAGSLAWFWWLHDHREEALRFLDAATSALGPRDAGWARARIWLAFHRWFQGQPDPGADVDAAIATATATGVPDDRAGEAHVLAAYTLMARGDLEAGERHLDRAEQRVGGAGWVTVAARFSRANLRLLQARPGEAAAQAQAAVDAARQTGDRWGEFQASHTLGQIASTLGEYGRAVALMDRALFLAGVLGAEDQIGAMQAERAAVDMLAGDLVAARRRIEDVLAAGRSSGTRTGQAAAVAYHVLAMLERRSGDLDAAERAYRAALERLRTPSGDARAEFLAGLAFTAAQRGDGPAAQTHARAAAAALPPDAWPLTRPLLLEAAAAAAAAAGDALLAARRLGAAAALRAAAGTPLVGGERFDVDRIEAQVRAGLGAGAEDELARGAALPPEDLLPAT